MKKVSNISIHNLEKILNDLVPEFKSSYTEYLNEHNNKKEFHSLFSFYLLPFFYIQYGHKNFDLVSRILYIIEEMLLSDDVYLNEVANVSFLEDIYNSQFGQLNQEDYHGLIRLMKPMSIEELKKIDDYYKDRLNPN